MTENDLFSIFRNTVDSEVVNKFLNKYKYFILEAPSDGDQYVISKELGIDLLFRLDEESMVRKCESVFLYAEGKDEHSQYSGFIPLSFTFNLSRQKLIEMSVPTRTWKIGEGEVEISFQNPSHDRWEFGNYYISAHYGSQSGSIMYFIISNKKA